MKHHKNSIDAGHEELDIINAQHISSNNHLPLNNSNMYSIQNSHSAYMNSSHLDNYPHSELHSNANDTFSHPYHHNPHNQTHSNLLNSHRNLND